MVSLSRISSLDPAWQHACDSVHAGIGAYTSAAMASIAAGEHVAAVDANVVRVLSRLRCLTADPTVKAGKLLHARLGELLVDPDRPGDFNQVCHLSIC